MNQNFEVRGLIAFCADMAEQARDAFQINDDDRLIDALTALKARADDCAKAAGVKLK